MWLIKWKEITSGIQKYCQKIFSTYLVNSACKIRCQIVNFWFFSKSARWNVFKWSDIDSCTLKLNKTLQKLTVIQKLSWQFLGCIVQALIHSFLSDISRFALSGRNKTFGLDTTVTDGPWSTWSGWKKSISAKCTSSRTDAVPSLCLG